MTIEGTFTPKSERCSAADHAGCPDCGCICHVLPLITQPEQPTVLATVVATK